MAQKEVYVRINGVESVSKATEQADGALSGFTSKAGSMLKRLAAVAAGLALGEFFKKAVEEATVSREAMGQLALAVENSGKSFAKMSPEIDETLSRLATMTKFGDDDFARAMQQMTLKTGDAEWALKNLGPAADLAAAGNIELEQAANMLALAHEGNTKALFRMMPELKGAVNWQEMLAEKTAGAAEAQMRQLGPLAAIEKQFGEFAESVGKAIIGGSQFEETGFSMAKMLADLSGWIEDNRGEIGKFIDVLIETGKNVVEAVTPSFQMLARIAGPALKLVAGLIAEAGFAIRAWSVYSEESAGKVIQAIGWIVEKGAKVLRAFGIDVGHGLADTIIKFGEKLDVEASKRWDTLVKDHGAFWTRIKAQGDEAVQTVAKQERAKTEAVRDEEANRKKELDEAIKAQEARWKLVDQAAVSYRKVIETLKPAIEKNVTLREIDAQGTALDAARKNADALIKKMQEHGALPPLIKPATDAVDATARKLSDAAGFALDTAKNIEGIDDEALLLLESCKIIGETLSSIAQKGLTFAGVTGVLGGVASLVNTMMQGDLERRNLTRQNNTRLEELNRGLSSLKLNVSGKDYESVFGALKVLMGNLSGGANIMPSLYQFDRSLFNAGLTQADLNKIADSYGISIRRKDGDIDLAQLQKLFEAMQRTGLGNGTRSLEDELQDRKNYASIAGAAAGEQARYLLDFLAGRGVGYLAGVETSDPQMIFQHLFKLYNSMTNGRTLGADELGGLTAGQLRDFIFELLQGLKGDSGQGTSSVSLAQSPTSSLSAEMVTAGGISMSMVSVQDAIAAMDTSMSSVLTEHTAFHQRIADATEGSYRELQLHTVLLGDLIEVCAGNADRINQTLADARALALANAGTGPSYG